MVSTGTLREHRSWLQDLEDITQELRTDQRRSNAEHERRLDELFRLQIQQAHNQDTSSGLISSWMQTVDQQAHAINSLRQQVDSLQGGLQKKLEGGLQQLRSELQALDRAVVQMVWTLAQTVDELGGQLKRQRRAIRRHYVRKLERLLKAEPVQQF
jgi:hypothetical protein